MICKIVDVEAPGCGEKGKLYTYFLDNSEEMRPDEMRPLILICPGGGYHMTSDREAEPLAMRFLAMGYHAAVLRYCVYPAEYPAALLQLGAAVKYLKENSDTYHIAPDKIIIQGSSAGGHLAGTFGVFWNKPWLEKALNVKSSFLRPAGLILNYPVITAGAHTHQGSFQHLLGSAYEQKKDELSLEKLVTKDTPRTFLWHTATDDCVPVENSILFFTALRAQGISAELHIYPTGGHGLGLANYETSIPNGYGIQPECQSWITLAETWLAYYRDIR